MRKRLALIAIIFIVLLALDWMHFHATGLISMINWRVPIHLVWVVASLSLFCATLYFYTYAWFRAAFIVNTAVLIAALFNQYFQATPLLISGCTMFNFALVLMYYVILATWPEMYLQNRQS